MRRIDGVTDDKRRHRRRPPRERIARARGDAAAIRRSSRAVNKVAVRFVGERGAVGVVAVGDGVERRDASAGRAAPAAGGPASASNGGAASAGGPASAWFGRLRGLRLRFLRVTRRNFRLRRRFRFPFLRDTGVKIRHQFVQVHGRNVPFHLFEQFGTVPHFTRHKRGNVRAGNGRGPSVGADKLSAGKRRGAFRARTRENDGAVHKTRFAGLDPAERPAHARYHGGRADVEAFVRL